VKSAIIDTGPIVALFNSRDKYYSTAVDFIRRSDREFITSIAVITEVTYLLDFHVNAQKDFLHWIAKGGVKIFDLDNSNLERCASLMVKYSDLPMDFADATLVVIGEEMNIREIVTLDSDFNIYKINSRKSFKNIFLTK